MDVADIYTLAIDQTHVNTTDFPNTRVLKYINLVKDDFWSYIVTYMNEDYNYDIFTTTSIVDQSEYVLPQIANDAAGVKKIKDVGIAYNSGAYDDGSLKYKKARLVESGSLRYDWNYYVNTQPATDPIYRISDKSIFIAPAFTSVVTNGIKCEGIKKIPDYAVDTVEADMIIPVDHHGIILQGVLAYIYKAEGGKLEEASFEKSEYTRLKEQAAKELIDRNISPTYIRYPEDMSYDDPYIITTT